MSAVRTDDLTVTYGSVLALDSVTIEIPCGSSVAIIGPNGCGKSTLLKTLAGIITPASGTVQVDGRPAMVLQSTDVDRSVPITVRDAVAMGRYPTLGPLRRFRPADWATVHEAMTRLAIDDLANRPIHYLSGGQRQRVLVAQGLTQESSVLLLDEPLTGLDRDLHDRLAGDLAQLLRDTSTTALLVTHDHNEAAVIADRTVALADLQATRSSGEAR